jgi:hypothetical protein
MYLGYSTLTPYVPAMVIVGNILNVDPYDTLSTTNSFIALAASLPVYLFLYVCFDQDFDIKKAFCNSKRSRNNHENQSLIVDNSIKLDNLTMKFDGFKAVENISLRIEQN